jgi:glycosyltransferase involved in cell wall biosynthesis
MAEMMAKRFDVDWRTLVGAKLHRWAKNYTAVRASQTIVTAPGNVTQAASYGITPDGIVPVGAEQRFFQDDTYDGGVDVLSVGRVEPRKQVHFVCHETPEEYTTVVAGGESDSNYATQMTERWIGRVSETRLLNLYQQAGVFVLPSYFEGFGLTAVEAMAARTPVIVNDRMPIAEWVRKYDLGGVYWWDDSASYRRTLDDVLSHREYYADNAQQFAEEHLTWEEIAARYEAIYEYTKRPESVTSVPASFDTESPLHN